MKRHHLFIALVCLALFFASGCEQQSIAEQEQIKTRQTLEATTPSATPSNTPTVTLTPTTGPSPTATTAPSATPLPTATVTPLPPTATPNPALAGFSLCSQVAGAADGGRFSARITAITTTIEPAFERVTIGLNIPNDSAPPHAVAQCLAAADDTGAAPGPAAAYSLHIALSDWLHDSAFKATTISPTLALSGTTLLKSLELRANPSADAGATLAFGLEQALPYRLKLESNPYRLVLDIGKTGTIGANNDMLALPASGDAKPALPIFYVQGGDAWKFADGKATNLTKDTRKNQSGQEQFGDVSALAASPTAKQVAFCAVAPGTDVGDRVAPRTLWLTDFDGKNPQALALQNLSCDNPVFAPDGKTIAFTVDETGANPPRFSIWTVASAGDNEQRITPEADEWSRFAPQWLGDGRLVYAAQAEDGRSTIFLHTADGAERDIGAELQRGSTYVALGRPIAAPDGSAIAVEALRTQGGADLQVIGPDGLPMKLPGTRPTPTPQATSQATPTADTNVIAPVTGGYWNRPLAWGSDGTLFYLTSACESTVAQSYTVHAFNTKTGDDRTIAAGTTLGSFGAAQMVGTGLAYTTLQQPNAGARGPLATSSGPSTLWFWDVGGNGQRAKLADAPGPIGALAP